MTLSTSISTTEARASELSSVRSRRMACNDERVSARWHLKRATDAAHRRLDLGLSGFDLSDIDDYRRFLNVHAIALPSLESALAANGFEEQCPGWMEGRRSAALMRDLAGLGGTSCEPDAARQVGGATAWGTAYVLEGSRLGAKLLARRVTAGGIPDALANARFLNHPASVAWPCFLNRMEHALSAPGALRAATNGARMAFAAFNDALDRIGLSE